MRGEPVDENRAGRPADVASVLKIYDLMEPGEADTWNPVLSEYELGYRLALYSSLARALACVSDRLASLRVLDYGCGNGRSTRTYLEFGLRAAQLTGVDIRPGAIEAARKLHPALRFEVIGGHEAPCGGSRFDWVGVTTVFSSVVSSEARQRLADLLQATLAPGGHLFYFDLIRANAFAGAERIGPGALFAALEPVWHRRLDTYRLVPASERVGLPRAEEGAVATLQRIPLLARIKRRLVPSHEVFLFRRPE